MPKVLVGNRLHLAFKRQVGERDAEAYAAKNRMAFFEVSPLCNFNIRESFSELSRMALHRNGMERLWRSNKGNAPRRRRYSLRTSHASLVLLFSAESSRTRVSRDSREDDGLWDRSTSVAEVY